MLAIALGAGLDPGLLRQLCPDEIERMLAAARPTWTRWSPTGRRRTGVVVSGRGHAYAAALELALKLKEACYLHAMGLSWADLLHGPIAVVDASTPAIIVAADSGPALPGSIELARRVVAAGARAYAIGGGSGLAAASSLAVPGPRLPEWLAPLGLIVPGQLLTEALSRRLRHRSGQPARPQQGHPDRVMTGMPSARTPESHPGSRGAFTPPYSISTARWWTARRAVMRAGGTCSGPAASSRTTT